MNPKHVRSVYYIDLALAAHRLSTLDSFRCSKPSGIVGKVVPYPNREIENESRLAEKGRQAHRTHTNAPIRVEAGWYWTLVRHVAGALQLPVHYLHQPVEVRIRQELAQTKGAIVERSLQQCPFAYIDLQPDS